MVIQANWRRYQARTKFLRDTEAGRRAAAKAAEDARRHAAAIRIQSNWRRKMAQKEAAVLKRQAARLKQLQKEKDALVAERAALAAALAEAEARAARAEADGAAKAARITTLESQVLELDARVASVKAEAATAVTASAAGASAAQEAAAHRASELEAAHKRAAAALVQEGEVAKRQRAEADERTAAAEEKLRQVQAELDATRAELAKQTAEIEELQAELDDYKDEALHTSRELVSARSVAEATAVAAAAEAAALSREAEERIAAAKADSASARAAEEKIDTLQKQLAVSEAKAKRNAAAIKDAQDKSSQLAARVEALSSRVQRMETEAHDAASREAALIQELDSTRRAAAAAAQAAASTLPRVRGPSPLSRPGLLQSPLSTPVRRTIAQELDAAAIGLESASPSRSDTVEAADLVPGHSELVIALTEAVVFQKLPCVDAWSGPGGTLVVPQAAWLLHKCLLHWAKEWRPAEVAAAAQHLETSIANVAFQDRTLSCAGYWLAASLATGALLKVRVVGKPDLQFLFKLADAFIGLTDLHIALGGVIAEEIPVDVALLLSEDAKRSARRRSTARAALAPVANGTPPGSRNVDSPASPADVELSHMGAAERHWRAILGGIANIVEELRKQGVPAAAVRAVVWATLRYIDGELLNNLLLRRDCCSVSAAKALLTGLAALKEISSFVGQEWGCEPEEAERALQRSHQAARYLVQGKDDCARKAQRSIPVLPDLTRQCAALTLQQVHRLTEHQHDDWLAASGSAMGNQTLMLLEALRRLMNEHRKHLGGPSIPSPARSVSSTTSAMAPTYDGSNRWVSFGEEESTRYSQDVDVEEEDLLVDPAASFAMFKLQQNVTRKLLTDAAKSFVQPGAAALVPPPTPSTAPTKGTGSPGPLLPNGNLPQLASSTTKPPGTPGMPPMTPTHSTMSTLTAIDDSCHNAGIPESLKSNTAFKFLK